MSKLSAEENKPFSAIGEQRSDAARQARHSLTITQYQQIFNKLSVQGYHLVWLPLVWLTNLRGK
ncbi:hypothetical protein [Brevibacillus laterosporus]|uniref:hypothetical protein n=1 Tax=Brevibacillus laterosporus TaxID=1465 RepID=UPI003D23B323